MMCEAFVWDMMCEAFVWEWWVQGLAVGAEHGLGWVWEWAIVVGSGAGAPLGLLDSFEVGASCGCMSMLRGNSILW
jgi:hypothetical protein